MLRRLSLGVRRNTVSDSRPEQERKTRYARSRKIASEGGNDLYVDNGSIRGSARSRSPSPFSGRSSLPSQNDVTNCLKSGNLKKKGDSWTSKHWVTRFVVLHNSDLLWFKSKKEKKPQNYLSLLGEGVELELVGCELHIATKKKKYTFLAESSQEMSKWHKEILSAQEMFREMLMSAEKKANGEGGESSEDESNLSKQDKTYKMLRKGRVFTKVNKYGVPQKRFIWFTNNLNRILWGLEGKKSVKGYIMVQDMKEVKQQDRPAKSQDSEGKLDNSFEISITGQDRRLTLRSSREIGEKWLEAIKSLVKDGPPIR